MGGYASSAGGAGQGTMLGRGACLPPDSFNCEWRRAAPVFHSTQQCTSFKTFHAEIYTLLDKGVAFERPDHLLQAVGLYDLTQVGWVGGWEGVGGRC